MAAKNDKPNWNSFTKAELVKTIKTLHARQTKLLNEITRQQETIAAYEAQLTEGAAAKDAKARRKAKAPKTIETPEGTGTEWVPPWAPTK